MGRKRKNKHRKNPPKKNRHSEWFEAELGGEEMTWKKGTDMLKLGNDIKSKNSYGSGGWGFQGGGGYATGHNHPGDKVVYERSDGKKLYASNQHSLDIYSTNWDLIIDLAGIISEWDSKKGFIKKCSEKFEPLKKLLGDSKEVTADVLKLDWMDYGPPKAPAIFWIKLWEYLPEKTVIACQGGHGRTGTCLACLMIADGVDYYTAVQTIRSEHCTKCIESLSQETYLHNLYKAILKASLKIGGNTPEQTADLTADLEYAESHPPNNKSSYGEDKPREKGESLKKNVGQTDVGGNKVYKYDEPAKATKRVFKCEKCGYTTEYFGYATTMKCKNPKNNCQGWMDPITAADKPADGKTPAAAYYYDKFFGLIKEENGVYFVKECLESTCKATNCENTNHKGWVEWKDFDPKAMGSMEKI